MKEGDSGRAARAARRSGWAGKLSSLDDAESVDDLSRVTTATERLGMMWQLALDAWASSGRAIPSYTREECPGRIVRRRG
jgi:hypothetical protein